MVRLALGIALSMLTISTSAQENNTEQAVSLRTASQQLRCLEDIGLLGTLDYGQKVDTTTKLTRAVLLNIRLYLDLSLDKGTLGPPTSVLGTLQETLDYFGDMQILVGATYADLFEDAKNHNREIRNKYFSSVGSSSTGNLDRAWQLVWEQNGCDAIVGSL